MTTPQQFINCPNGQITNENWGRADRALIVDLSAYLGSVKQMRNVALARTVNVGSGNVVTDMDFSLPNNGNLPPAEYKFSAPNGNIATLITSSLPVHLWLTTPYVADLDLGPVTMIVLTSPIIGLRFVNDQKEGSCEVKLVVV